MFEYLDYLEFLTADQLRLAIDELKTFRSVEAPAWYQGPEADHVRRWVAAQIRRVYGELARRVTPYKTM